MSKSRFDSLRCLVRARVQIDPALTIAIKLPGFGKDADCPGL